MDAAPRSTPRWPREFPILDAATGGRRLPRLGRDRAEAARGDRRDGATTTARPQRERPPRRLPARRRGHRAFEGARARIAALASARPSSETIFTKNATEAINLVAYSWGRRNVGAGDRDRAHARWSTTRTSCRGSCSARRSARSSSYVRARRRRARSTSTQLDDAARATAPKLVAVAHVSNVLGTINPVARDRRAAPTPPARSSLIDGAQAVPQLPVDVGAIGADFYGWTGHKVYGPTGIGVLHGRRELLEAMPPFLGGGDMITLGRLRTSRRWTELPWKFEAGTSPVAEADRARRGRRLARGARHGHRARARARAHRLRARAPRRVPGLSCTARRDAERRGALVSFALDGLHPHDVAEILGRDGVCVRAGHHCAQPLMRRLGVTRTSRASLRRPQRRARTSTG